jgi:hypothetical protein
MKYLCLFFLFLPLWLNAQTNGSTGPPSHRHGTKTPSHRYSPPAGASELEPVSTLSGSFSSASAEGSESTSAGNKLEDAMRKLGPDLITARLTIDANLLDHLLSLLETEQDLRLILAVDHSALSVRYALVHRLLEDLEAYPSVKSRVDIEMYAPISDFHTTWLYRRGLGHLMIRLERLSR